MGLLCDSFLDKFYIWFCLYWQSWKHLFCCFRNYWWYCCRDTVVQHRVKKWLILQHALWQWCNILCLFEKTFIINHYPTLISLIDLSTFQFWNFPLSIFRISRWDSDIVQSAAWSLVVIFVYFINQDFAKFLLTWV